MISKRVLSSDSVRPNDAPIRVGVEQFVAPAPTPQQNDPKVETVCDEFGNAMEIHVTCKCGETTIVSLDYGDR